MSKYNILFITADQWRGDCLSGLGHPTLKTPNLDQLSQEGVLFKNHFCQIVPCGPSRASLFTGLYAHNHRSVINGIPLDNRLTNIAKELLKAGYEPALFGYTDTSLDPRDVPKGDKRLKTYENVLPGFKRIAFTGSDNEKGDWHHYLEKKGYDKIPTTAYSIDQQDLNSSTYFQQEFLPPSLYKEEDSDTAFLTQEAIQYIKKNKKQPWSVFLNYLSPHPPFVVSDPFHTMYNYKSVPNPIRSESIDQEAKQHPFLKYCLTNKRDGENWYFNDGSNAANMEDRQLKKINATYFGMMSLVDKYIGKLINILKDEKLFDQTLIVFSSDHGEQMGDHWLIGKLGYCDESYHVPLIIKSPSDLTSVKGLQIKYFTESIDLMPTLLDVIGATVPQSCDGQSLRPFLIGTDPDHWRSEVHWEFDFRGDYENSINRFKKLGLSIDQCSLAVIRDQKYKYVHFNSFQPLLFDLSKDPHQFMNISNDPSYQHIVSKYSQKLLSWHMDYPNRSLSYFQATAEGTIERRD